MAIDYREHKSVSKNRPRKQPAGIFFFSIFVAVIIAYTLGLVTGWLVFRPAQRESADSRTNPADANIKGAGTPAQGPALPAEGSNGAAPEPMLTFYDRLPKGNRDLLGSGLNASRPPEETSARVAPPPPAPAVKEEAQPAETATKPKEANKVPARPAETAVAKDAPAKESSAKETPAREDAAKVRYIVQVASYHVKKEAEELRDRLKAGGLPAYIVESNLAEKGTFYRVRVGRHLDQKAAQETAAKAGGGAIVIPE
jgi:cell division septation protein DedD